ncbi:hypothetical protein Peur_025771 [Populus x canadensis]
MKPQYLLSSFSFFLLLLHCTNTFAQSPAAVPAQEPAVVASPPAATPTQAAALHGITNFQTVSNPLGTWAGTGSRLPLNVPSYTNSVNIITGLTNTSLSGTVYTDNQLAIYKIEKVLLRKDIFASNAPAPAPAPVAPAPEKPTKAVPAVTVESPAASVDISSALIFTHNLVVGSVGLLASAMFSL